MIGVCVGCRAYRKGCVCTECESALGNGCLKGGVRGSDASDRGAHVRQTLPFRPLQGAEKSSMIFGYLSKIAKRTRKSKGEPRDHPINGYFAVAEAASSNLPELAPGLILDNRTDEPPWFVVDHELHTMTIPNWPFHLWKVHALKSIKPQNHAGNYIRCSAIKILERLPAHLVFGETDTGIGDLLEFGRTMTLDQAQSLSKLRCAEASGINSKVWQRWIKQNGVSNSGLTNDFDNVLSVGRSQGNSPIRSGLLLLSRVVFDHAGRVDGEKAYSYDQDGSAFLTNPWDAACSTLKDAALSFGASDLCNEADIAALRRPLRQVAPDLVRKIEDKVKA